MTGIATSATTKILQGDSDAIVANPKKIRLVEIAIAHNPPLISP